VQKSITAGLILASTIYFCPWSSDNLKGVHCNIQELKHVLTSIPKSLIKHSAESIETTEMAYGLSYISFPANYTLPAIELYLNY
jgi:hypothetical protein